MQRPSTVFWGLDQFITISIISFSISFIIFPILIKISTRWKLFDLLSEHKIHVGFTPSAGGVAIFIGVFATLSTKITAQEWAPLYIFLISLLLMLLVGLSDDVWRLRPIQKIIGQLLPVLILVSFDKDILSTSYEFFGIQIFAPWPSVIISVIAIILITNAYNLIDGLDGLAGLVGILCLSFLGSWFYLAGHPIFSIIILSFISSLMAFLIFNWQPAKIFMGDTGTLPIGMVLAYYAIKFVNINHSLAAEHIIKFEGAITTMICILIIPVFDTSRIIILRIRKLKSPLKADNNHLHHKLVQRGFTHTQAVYFLLTINLFFVLLAILLRKQSDFVMLPIVIIVCVLINFALERQKSYERKNIEFDRGGQ